MSHLVSNTTRATFRAINWPAVVCFYGLACAISFALRHAPSPTEGWLPRPGIFTFGLGPIGAALICRRLFPSVPMIVSVLGTSPGRTLLFVGLPLWLGCLFGVANKHGINPHLFGGLFALSAVLYGFVEEMGWRGFLHSALRPLPAAWRVGITALLWLGWHLTFMPDLSSVVAGPKNPLWMLLGLFVLGSWGLGNAVERTRSVLVVGALHDFMDLTRSPVALGVLVVGWAWLLWRWHRDLMPALPAWLRRFGIASVLMVGTGAVFAQPTSLPKQKIDLTRDVPDFSLFDKAFYDNQLFLLGESHGYQKPQAVDLAEPAGRSVLHRRG